MRATVSPPRIGVKAKRFVKVPSPTVPAELSPAHCTSPEGVTPQMPLPHSAICLKLAVPRVTSTGLSDRRSRSSTWPIPDDCM